MEQPFNIWRLVLIVGFIGLLALLFWMSFRPKNPSCRCGKEGTLLRRQEIGQRTIMRYSCSCGNVWSEPQVGLEDRQTFN